jgi:hypothetical protein
LGTFVKYIHPARLFRYDESFVLLKSGHFVKFEVANHKVKKNILLNKLLFLFIFFILPDLGYSQVTLCDCCVYESLFWTENFEQWFPPENIKKSNIHELTVYITSKRISKSKQDTIYQSTDTEYREMILKFNENGYVIERIIFSQFGQFSYTNVFERDNDNQITTNNFYYLDSAGVRDENFLRSKWIYLYDQGKLVKMKELGPQFVEMPDSQSIYFSYKYDSSNRLIEQTHHVCYDWVAPYSIRTTIEYQKENKLSVTNTTYEGQTSLTEKTIYNVTRSPLMITKFDNGKKTGTRKYAYDNKGRLVKLTITSISGYTECPDGGNLTERYTYTDLNILNSIIYKYKKAICTMRLEFR